jgi:serine/threonine protein kinase
LDSLKPENILIDKHGYPVITDFGLCKDGVIDKTTSFCGTAEYMAPEIILKQPYTKAVDWWSFGAIIYEMLCGLPPFYTSNKEKLFKRIIRNFNFC